MYHKDANQPPHCGIHQVRYPREGRDLCADLQGPYRCRAGGGAAGGRLPGALRTAGMASGPVYVDNDVSAYSGQPRPAWRELLTDLEHGRADAVVCWHVDRLTRSPRELEDVIDLHDGQGIV